MKDTGWAAAEVTWKSHGFDVDMFEQAKITTLGDAMVRLAPYVEALKAKVIELDAENEALRRELQRYRDPRLPAPRREG